jgi:hypothetical protein
MTCEQFSPNQLILKDPEFYFEMLYATTSPQHPLVHRVGEYESVVGSSSILIRVIRGNPRLPSSLCWE